VGERSIDAVLKFQAREDELLTRLETPAPAPTTPMRASDIGSTCTESRPSRWCATTATNPMAWQGRCASESSAQPESQLGQGFPDPGAAQPRACAAGGGRNHRPCERRRRRGVQRGVDP